jgi:hypothetical protein
MNFKCIYVFIADMIRIHDTHTHTHMRHGSVSNARHFFRQKKIETQDTTEHIQTIVDQKRFICRGLNY